MENTVQLGDSRKINLGCGKRFHSDWVNVDFSKTGEGVIAHNLLAGIPFEKESFAVVYHSHVLEHFSRKDGKKFIEECYRILKHNGIIRIAIPDLEQIVRNYLTALEKSLQGDLQWQQNYEWIMLELYDQTVRGESGGDMGNYFYQDEIPNEEFVYSRVGEEGRAIRRNFLRMKEAAQNVPPTSSQQPTKKPAPSFFKNLFSPAAYKLKLKNHFAGEELKQLKERAKENEKYVKLGKFRLGGEVHQWMYDRYSLKKLLEECGFTDIKVQTCTSSEIEGWNDFKLDAENGIAFKPDSLFVEARKSK